MTTPGALTVTSDGLRVLAQRCVTLAGRLAADPTAVAAAASVWQSTAASVNTVTASAGKAGTVLSGRLRATGNKLTTAATDYESTDGQAGAGINGLDIPGSGIHPGGDGVAGALPVPAPGGYPLGDGGAGAG